MSAIPSLTTVLAILAAACPAVALAQPSGTAPGAYAVDVAPQQGVLLLRNGRTLHGKYTRDGDRFYLALPGGEIRIRAAEVEVACESLDACYIYRRQRVDAGNVNSHLDLAQWCIEHELLGPAAEQLAVALSIDPRHPKLVLLQRRIEVAQTAPPPRAAAEAGTEAEPADFVDADMLDKLCRSLPPGTVEMFTNRIHPLLQNHCGNAGCHGSQTTSQFRMVRAPANKAASSRITQRNLFAALQMINRENPTGSVLLTQPIKPHGSARQAIFKTHDIAQYNELVQWVMGVAGPAVPARSTTVGATAPGLIQPSPHAKPLPIPGDRGQVETVSAIDPKTATHASLASFPHFERATDPSATATAAPGSLPSPSPQRPTTLARPNDPFHPELFNRRFFPQGNPREQKAAESPPKQEPTTEPETTLPVPTELGGTP